ncbi:MAG: hypothetical protein R2754_15925 [Microthrixaceae bacterium]
MLVPAGVLIVVLMGAIVVDLSAAHMAQRRLVQVTERAADDAAGMLDRNTLRSGGGIRLDPAAARNLAHLQVAALEMPGLQRTWVTVTLTPDGQGVVVSSRARVRRHIGRAVPGVGRTYDVKARATARLE